MANHVSTVDLKIAPQIGSVEDTALIRIDAGVLGQFRIEIAATPAHPADEEEGVPWSFYDGLHVLVWRADPKVPESDTEAESGEPPLGEGLLDYEDEDDGDQDDQRAEDDEGLPDDEDEEEDEEDEDGALDLRPKAGLRLNEGEEGDEDEDDGQDLDEDDVEAMGAEAVVSWMWPPRVGLLFQYKGKRKTFCLQPCGPAGVTYNIDKYPVGTVCPRCAALAESGESLPDVYAEMKARAAARKAE